MKKNFIKIVSVFVFAFVLLISKSAFADTLPIAQWSWSGASVDNDTGILNWSDSSTPTRAISLFMSDGSIMPYGGGQNYFKTNWLYLGLNQFLTTGEDNYKLVVRGDRDCGITDDYATCTSTGYGYILILHSGSSTSNIVSISTWGTPPVIPVPSGIATTGLFFGRTNGHSTASTLVASAGTATSASAKSLGPIMAIVLGILLAFIFIRYIVNLINETKQDKSGKRKI